MNDVIANMYSDMEGIRKAVATSFMKNVPEFWCDEHKTFCTTLTHLGLDAAVALASWNEDQEREHDMGWVIKKANDALDMCMRDVKRAMNIALGYPEDFNP